MEERRSPPGSAGSRERHEHLVQDDLIQHLEPFAAQSVGEPSDVSAGLFDHFGESTLPEGSQRRPDLDSAGPTGKLGRWGIEHMQPAISRNEHAGFRRGNQGGCELDQTVGSASDQIGRPSRRRQITSASLSPHSNECFRKPGIDSSSRQNRFATRPESEGF